MKRLLLLAFLVILFIFPSGVWAAGEFTSDYRVNYDVDESGITIVTEDITFTNQTEKYYPSSFSLTIGATKLNNVEAKDSQGVLPVEVNNLGKKTQITVRFNNQQVVGVGKQYKWSLKFNSSDFAQAQGKVWQVSVPKISSAEEINDYVLTLAVPVSFGDPTTMLPEPARQLESGGKLNFIFNKEQLSESGILANFGVNQLFDYALEYHLENDTLLPALAKLSIPGNTDYQEVIVNNLEPAPENVILDDDGNSVAYYELDRKQSLVVRSSGIAKLSLKSFRKGEPISSEQRKLYTSEQKYWESNSPQVKSKLKEIFKDGEPKTTAEKAKLIHKYVANNLQYDETRLRDENFQRLGAVTALANPSQALCSEYTDLFISLARAAGIPARQLVGYAYTSNTDIRPLSLDGTVLHTWPEYYDDEQGWVMIDPTWESTTGGVDYFSKFDLNHFVLATRGVSPESPIAPDTVTVKFYDGKFEPQSKLNLSMDAQSEIFAGFPAKIKVKVLNSGNYLTQVLPFQLSSSKIGFSSKESKNSTSKNYKIGPIPPNGALEFEFNMLTGPIWQSFEDVVQLKAGEEALERKILVRPFFAYKFFSYSVGGTLAGVVIVYLLVLTHHIKSGAEHISEPGGQKRV